MFKFINLVLLFLFINYYIKIPICCRLRVPKQDVNGTLEADSVPAIKLSLVSSIRCSAQITR